MTELKARRKKSMSLVLAAGLTLAGTGVAFAYWTSTGSGTGTAQTGRSVAFVVTSEKPVGDLSPGSRGQTVDFTVTNPGEGVLSLTTVTVRFADADGNVWVPTKGCSFDDYRVEITTAPPAGEIPPGESVKGTATVTLANTDVNQDACQGELVPLYFEVDGPAAAR